MPAYGFACLDSSTPALDFIHIGFSMSARTLVRLGLLSSAYGMQRPGPLPLAPDLVHIGLPSSPRGFG